MQFCPKCGKEISNEMQFCPGCGNSIDTISTPALPTENKPIENSAASEPYMTVQYTPGYEQASEPPKKKVNKRIPAFIAIAIIIIGGAVGVIKYFTGDAYKYKKAVEMINAGNYETAFSIFYKLGDYKDSESYLPFHGKYVSTSIEDGRYLEFTDGKYEKMLPGSDGSSYYYGTYVTDEYKSAVITDEDDGDTETYTVYKNYIYESGSEDFVFDERVDISSGPFNGEITEMATFEISDSDVWIKWDYKFENDGTYTLISDLFLNGKEIGSPSKETGTYEIDGDFIKLTSNDDGDEISFLVIDGYVYRSVYVRDY